ncbi:hypothetical protein ACH34W_00600 [Actinomadura sp. 6N118]
MDAIEETIPLLGSSLEEFFPPSRADLIKSALDLRSKDPASWQFDTDSAEEFLRRYDELPEEPIRPAVGPFLMALVRLFEAPPHAISSDDVMEVLYSCYESVLTSHLTGRVTLEDEQNSDRCVAAIAQQLRIIEVHMSPDATEP